MGDDRDELTRCYEAHGPIVWRYLRRRVADRGVAEELFQEVFLAVARSPEGLAAADSQRAWLLGIARNLVLGRYRSAARERDDVELDAAAVVAASDRGDDDPRLEAMRRAIGRLPMPQREVIEMKLGDDLTYAEIASALDVPIGTVRSRMHHAVYSLKQWASGVEVERLMDGRA